MPLAACPTEHELLARARGEGADASGAVDAVDAHLAECSECRIVVSELARGSQAAPLGSDVRSITDQATPPRPTVVSGDLVDGKYRITGVLGRGGMGLVLDAIHEVLGTRVAIKVPTLDLRDDSGARARLLREARVVARLEGEYVGRVLDAGILTGGFPFVVFEYLEGRTLAERLRDDGPLAAMDAVDVIVEACAGLSVAHAAGIVHRDVKPSNLFETRRADGSTTVRVIDFGIAKQHVEGETLTRSRMVLGTPAYMAPEQVLARPVDARADVWALGMTLLELVTGRAPNAASFARLGEGVGALARDIQEASGAQGARRHSSPSSSSGATRRVALAIERVIAQCLRDRVEDRYASVAALAQALAPVAGARGLAALRSIGPSVGSVAPARRGVGRASLLVAAAAAVLGLVAFGARRSLQMPVAVAREASSIPLAPAPVPSVVPALAPSASAVPSAAQQLVEAVPVRPAAPAPPPAPVRHVSKPPPSAVAAPALPKGDAESAARPPKPVTLAPRDSDGLGDRK